MHNSTTVNLEILYKVFFNYFLKKDGYSKVLHLLASCVCTLNYVFVLGTMVMVINISSNNYISFKIKKLESLLLILILFFIAHLVHFSILKFPRIGENQDSSFIIEAKVYKLTLKTALYILLVFFATTIVNIIIN